MHVILRRALLFLFPLIFLSFVLTYLVHSISDLPKKPASNKVLSKPSPKSEHKGSKETEQNKTKEASAYSVAADTKLVSVDSHPVIVLDPTHGGSDFGSLSQSSVLESNINLVFSFKLARALRMKGFKVFLTRMDDTNPGLEERFLVAVKNSSIIYLSINCAYSHNKKISGVEIYGFTSETQHTEIERIKNGFYEFYEGVYATKDMDALELENRVAVSIKRELDLSYRSRLLRRSLKILSLPANIPALAIFIGYLSNEREAKKLSDPKYTDDLAEKLATAVEDGVIRKI